MAIEAIATAPAIDLAPHEVEALIAERGPSPALDRPLFRRREPRPWAPPSLHGWLLELPRQAMEPMVLAREGAKRHTVRALPPWLSAGAWEDNPIRPRHGQEVDRELGADAGVLTLEGSDFPTPGDAAGGVQRPSCGARGKRANGQAGVCLGSASRQGDTWLDRRLSRPQAWGADEA